MASWGTFPTPLLARSQYWAPEYGTCSSSILPEILTYESIGLIMDPVTGINNELFAV